jgi:hypothetical protein
MIVLLGHLVLLVAQAAVAVHLANNAAIITHIFLVGVHAMVRDTVKVVHWIAYRDHGVGMGVRAIVRAMVHRLWEIALDEQEASGVEDIMERQTAGNDVQT